MISAHFFCTNLNHHFVGRNLLSTKTKKRFKNISYTAKSYETGTILHYMIKTPAEFERKKIRGDGAFKFNKNNDDYFKSNDFKECQTIIDKDIIRQLDRHIEDIKNQINIQPIKEQKFSSILQSKILSFGISPVGGYQETIRRFRKKVKTLFSTAA